MLVAKHCKRVSASRQSVAVGGVLGAGAFGALKCHLGLLARSVILANASVATCRHHRIMPVTVDQCASLLEEWDRLPNVTVTEQHASSFAVRLPRVRVQLEGSLNLPFGVVGSALVLEVARFNAMRFGELWVERERTFGGRKRIGVPRVPE